VVFIACIHQAAVAIAIAYFVRGRDEIGNVCQNVDFDDMITSLPW
jgi:hypothetical protein